MSDALWGFIGVIVGAALTGTIELLRDRTAQKERARKERAEAYTQLLLAARRLRYAARGDGTIDPSRIDEYKTDLSTAQYLIELLSRSTVVQAGEAVRRSVLDYLKAREERGAKGDCEQERLAARTAVDEFKAAARPEFS